MLGKNTELIVQYTSHKDFDDIFALGVFFCLTFLGMGNLAATEYFLEF